MTNEDWMGLTVFWVVLQLPPQPGPDSAEKIVCALRLENRKLWEEQILLQETCEVVKKLFKEFYEKICDPWAEQHQVGWGSGDMLSTCPTISIEASVNHPPTQSSSQLQNTQVFITVIIWKSLWRVVLLIGTEWLANKPSCSARNFNPFREMGQSHITHLHVMVVRGLLCRELLRE